MGVKFFVTKASEFDSFRMTQKNACFRIIEHIKKFGYIFSNYIFERVFNIYQTLQVPTSFKIEPTYEN